MTTITRDIHFAIKGRHKRAVLTLRRDPKDNSGDSLPARDETTNACDGRVPRISKLMALAIRFDGLLRDGVVANQSELAELAQASQPRMTQIMNLLHLAPEIQEQTLFLEPVLSGRDPITERDLRSITQDLDWNVQLTGWKLIESCN